MAVLDAVQFFPQRQPFRRLTQHEKPRIRKHLAQPQLHELLENKPQQLVDNDFRLYWRKSHLTEPKPRKEARPSRRLPNFHKFTGQASLPDESLTQKWLRGFTFDGTVIPNHLSLYEFPGGDVAGNISTRGPQRKRTEEDKRRVEVVLKTPIPALAEYVSPEMMKMIKQSPYKARDENVTIFRSHRHQRRRQNLQECYRILSRFIRNVASEIVYREKRIAADEKMYREEGAIDDSP